MIERHGTHVCKNPDCCGMIAWTVFLQNDRLKEDKPIVIDGFKEMLADGVYQADLFSDL